MALSFSIVSASEVIGEDVGYAAGYLFGGWDVEELVGAVGVGVGAEDSGDEELCLREALAEHPHERNRAAFAHVGSRLAEVVIRGGVEAALEPRR